MGKLDLRSLVGGGFVQGGGYVQGYVWVCLSMSERVGWVYAGGMCSG